MLNDQEAFVEGVCERLAQRADSEGIAALSRVQQTVLLPWWISGIVDNGGFWYFYQGAWDVDQVAQAFDEIGLREAAEACRRTRAAFPDDLRLDDQEYRVQWMMNHADEIQPVLAPADHLFWALGDQLLEALSRFIRANEQEVARAFDR